MIQISGRFNEGKSLREKLYGKAIRHDKRKALRTDAKVAIQSVGNGSATVRTSYRDVLKKVPKIVEVLDEVDSDSSSCVSSSSRSILSRMSNLGNFDNFKHRLQIWQLSEKYKRDVKVKNKLKRKNKGINKHSRKKDSDFLVGVELNPGPYLDRDEWLDSPNSYELEDLNIPTLPDDVWIPYAKIAHFVRNVNIFEDRQLIVNQLACQLPLNSDWNEEFENLDPFPLLKFCCVHIINQQQRVKDYEPYHLLEKIALCSIKKCMSVSSMSTLRGFDREPGSDMCLPSRPNTPDKFEEAVSQLYVHSSGF